MSEHEAAKIVAAPFRTDEEILAILTVVSAQPAGADALARRRTLDVLDDCAEEMIGRNHRGAADIRAQIRAHSDRLRESLR